MATDYISREALLRIIDGIWDCNDMIFEPNDHCCVADDCGSCKWRETKNAIRKIAATIPAADVIAKKDFNDCRNELCLQCGRYRESHLGACDGCRWQAEKWR